VSLHQANTVHFPCITRRSSTTRQNVVVYARMLTYNDGVLWPQNLAVAIANYTFITDTYHQIHINLCLKVLTLPIILIRQKTNQEQHEFTDISSSPCSVNTSTKHR